MASGSLILQSFLLTSPDEKTSKRRYNKKINDLLRFNKENHGGDFLTPLNYYIDILENTDPVLFPYMNEQKSQECLRDLQVTLLLLKTQKKYEQEHQKTENVASYNDLINTCHRFINALQYAQYCKENNIRPAPEFGYATDGYPVKYLSISYGQWFADQISGMMNRKTKTIKEGMGAFNEKRLYWVWASGLIKTFIAFIPSDFWNTEQGKQTIQMPDPYTGCLSWSLYYFRFSLNLSLLLKRTIRGPWMSKVEKNMPWYERFLTQFDQRKFALLNDSVWATGNLLCYFWLYGSGTLGAAGDALTLALLLFDISLAVWEFIEEETQYNKEMLDYETNIAKLKKQMDSVPAEGESNADYSRKIREYQLQLSALERAQKHCENEWHYKKINLIINITYAVGLMLAFFLLAAPFIPAMAVVGPAGAVLCFALTVISNALKGGMEIHKIKSSLKETHGDINEKIEEFKALLTPPQGNEAGDSDEMKFLFLEIKKLMAGSKYQQQKINLQIAYLVKSIIFETLIPAIILVNLVFLPTGIGFAALGGVIALAIVTHLIINAALKPEKEDLKPFNTNEYDMFCQNPDAWLEKSANSPAFFKQPDLKDTQDLTQEARDAGEHPSTDNDLKPQMQ